MSVFVDQAKLMKAFGNTVGTHNNGQALLYSNLVEEECVRELLPAVRKYDGQMRHGGAADQQTMIELADGIIDSIVVLIGLGHSLGFPMGELWDEVLRSNWSKTVDGNVLKREDGKALKPDSYSPPEIGRILFNL